MSWRLTPLRFPNVALIGRHELVERVSLVGAQVERRRLAAPYPVAPDRTDRSQACITH